MLPKRLSPPPTCQPTEAKLTRPQRPTPPVSLPWVLGLVLRFRTCSSCTGVRPPSSGSRRLTSACDLLEAPPGGVALSCPKVTA